jgi:hypothetical protein
MLTLCYFAIDTHLISGILLMMISRIARVVIKVKELRAQIQSFFVKFVAGRYSQKSNFH